MSFVARKTGRVLFKSEEKRREMGMRMNRCAHIAEATACGKGKNLRDNAVRFAALIAKAFNFRIPPPLDKYIHFAFGY